MSGTRTAEAGASPQPRSRLERALSRPALALLIAWGATGAVLLTGGSGTLARATLLVHVGLGIAGAPLVLLWTALHARALWHRDAGPSRALAAATGLLLLGAVASGVGVAVAHVLGETAAPWTGVHLAGGAVVLLMLPMHVMGAGAREGDRARLRGAALGGLGSATAGIALLASALDARPGTRAAPSDYPRGADGGLFSPSLVETVHGGFVELEALTGSASCGGCHEQIFEEWSSSTHRFSGIDNVLISETIRPAEERRGVAAARFCAACHEPVALLAGAVEESVFEVPATHLEQGVTCLVCHGIQEVPGIEGNGQMRYAPPDTFGFHAVEGELATAANRLLVAAFPDAHRRALRPPILSQSHQCSSCHTVNANEGFNGFGFVRLHNENDDWSLSMYAQGVPPDGRVVRCQDCHMPLVEGSTDPVAARRGGVHRSHRFIAANTFVALHLGGPEQLELTEAFLRGELTHPELEGLVPEGPIVGLDIEAPDAARPGAELSFDVVVENRSVGHAFPAGNIEIHETWLHVTVRDGRGELLFESGTLDADGHRDPGSFALIAIPVDSEGREIHVTAGLAAGFRYRNSILHGSSERASYRLEVPPSAAPPLAISARLRYRKADGAFIELLPDIEPRDVPVTDIVAGRAELDLEPAASGIGM